MIGWLHGQLRDSWQQANRCGVLLEVHGIGYEVQLSRRQFAALPAMGQGLSLHIQHSIREDAWTLFGFAERCERDLFRDLVAVSGVGPQVALGLLGQLEPQQLVRAIIHADLRLLSQAPGVGKRTAERLAVELRVKLQQRYGDWASTSGAGEPDPFTGETVIALAPEGRDELQLTLAALGYEPLEIQRALRAVAHQLDASAQVDTDTWIRVALQWLARDSA